MIVTRNNFRRIASQSPTAILVDFTAATKDPEAVGKCIDGVFMHFDIYQSGAPSDGAFFVKLFGRFCHIPAKQVFAV